MSFPDPQSLTVNAVAISLPRTSTQANSGQFTAPDANLKLSVSSSYGKRVRRTVRIDTRKTAADPLFPSQNAPYSMSTYIVTDAPLTGYTVVEQKQIVDALTAWLTATSGSNVTKLLGGEN